VIGDILQPTHLLLILVVALLVLGPKRLPEVGRSLGRGLRDFRHAVSGQEQEPGKPAIEAAQNGDSPPPVEEGASAPAQEPAGVSAERGSTGSA
jgi:sec-independent protein translocase protein TatA